MAIKKREGKRIPKYVLEDIEVQAMENTFRDKNLFKDIKYKKVFKNDKQKDLYDKILKNRIVFIRGSAGTGKTIISLMAALECLKNTDIHIDKISITKPIVEVSKSLGALPGDEKEKTGVYFSHFYDNLEKLLGKFFVDKMKSENLIEEVILNYVRGSTFGTYDSQGNPIGKVCILDEAQNTTVGEIKTFISRMGENTKLIICGDSDQIDIKLPKGEVTGFDYCFKNLRDIKNVDFVEFTEDDIVREPMLIEIMKRFKTS
jgi:phosphate starvation-inducible PhoH-like protein